MDWDFPYSSMRMPVLAGNVVATTQPLAAQAGLSMLHKGGTAVDAAIATAITLTVVEPAMNGIGSDAFAIVADVDGKLHGLNASGRAPTGWTAGRFAGRTAMPTTGWDSATVPGAVSAWVTLHGRFGRLPFEALFEPAIRYARDGFNVSPIISRLWQQQVEVLGAIPGFAEAFLPNGRAPRPGERFRHPAQAETLEAIAETKGEAFYRGRIADAIVAAAAKGGGTITLDDLGTHTADWVEPLGIDFRGVRIHEIPPNGQGIAALIALGILDRLDIDDLAADSVELQHLEVEAMKLAFADLLAHVSDPRTMLVQAEELLAPAYLDARAKLIRREQATAPHPGKPGKHGTVYLAAADSSGMMVSYIQSNFRGFGSGIVVPGGIALNNRGSYFVLDPAHPNVVAPGKRPLNTIIPGFATRNGKPLAAFGVMGGSMQPQGHLQVAMRMFAKGQNPQAALDAPRWRVEGNELFVETKWGAGMRDSLAALGHQVEEGGFLDFGAGQVILKNDAGGYVAASEPRRDGAAVGF